MLLAVSLRKHWPATVELIACVPNAPEFGGVSEPCAKVLGGLGVRFQHVENPIGPSRPIANKLLCLDVATTADRVIFLDSDIVALSSASEGELEATFGGGFVAKPADKNSSRLDEAGWENLYAEFDLICPRLRVEATVTGEFMPPYYNSGVLAMGANSNFGQLWTHYYREVAGRHGGLSQLPIFDQIPLSLALTHSGYTATTLGHIWNFPAHLQPLERVGSLPKLCHYHYPMVLKREKQLADAALEFANGHPGILDAMRRIPHWKGLVEGAVRPNPPADVFPVS